MKKIRLAFFAILITVTSVVSAQEAIPNLPVDPDTKLITYKEVVNQTGSKRALFDRAVEWLPKQ